MACSSVKLHGLSVLLCEGFRSMLLDQLLLTGFVMMQNPADSTVFNPSNVVPVTSSSSNATATAG